VRTKANPAVQPFEDLAERYDAWYDTAPGRVLFDLELGALRPVLAGTVGPRLEVGLDPAEAPLRLAKARGVRVVRGAGEQLPFRNNTFGAVVLGVTLCFAGDPEGLLAEAVRVLGPGGRLVVGLVPLDSAWGRSYAKKGRAGHPFYRHARFQTLAGHRRMLATAGFRNADSCSTLLQAPCDGPVNEPVQGGVAAGAGFVALAVQREDAGAD